MRKVLNDETLKTVCENIAKVVKQSAISFEKAEKAFVRFAKISQEHHNAWLAGYKYTHPRVVHLAYHSRKFRVRKKNRNRIRRMK